MIDLAAVPEHIREWVTAHVVPELQKYEDELTTLRGVAEEYAQLGLDAALRELARLQSEAPAAAALIEDAEKAVAKWQALVQRLEGGAPSGM